MKSQQISTQHVQPVKDVLWFTFTTVCELLLVLLQLPSRSEVRCRESLKRWLKPSKPFCTFLVVIVTEPVRQDGLTQVQIQIQIQMFGCQPAKAARADHLRQPRLRLPGVRNRLHET